MTDKEILGTIYRWVQQANSRDENPDHTRQRLKDIQNFIEQEWQKKDEKEYEQQSKSLGQFSKHWYKEDYPNGPSAKEFVAAQAEDYKQLKETLEVASEEGRHRGLEISEDGTVTKLT